MCEELTRLDGKPLDAGLPKHIVEAAGWKKWFDEAKRTFASLTLDRPFPMEKSQRSWRNQRS